MRAMDLGAELGAQIYVFWGGREGAEVDATKDPVEAIKRFREAIDFLCEYALDQKYDLQFALEAKPNEPRGDIYFPTTGGYLAFIATLAHPEMCGVNPEFAHEHMAGLNFFHDVAQAHRGGQAVPHRPERPGAGPLRPGLPLRLGAIKGAFFLVKLLEDSGYNGPRHFDATPIAQRMTTACGSSRAAACGRYLILKEKAQQFDADARDPGAARRDSVSIRGRNRAARALFTGQGIGAQGTHVRSPGPGRAAASL